MKRLCARIVQSICRRALAKTRYNTLLFRRLGPILDPMGFALIMPGLAWRGARKDQEIQKSLAGRTSGLLFAVKDWA